MKKAKIADIFFSTQGEGIFAGSKQVFVRFYGCMLNCRFCDTPLSAYDKYSPLELFRQLKRFTKNPYDFLCLTGGEPLLQKDFLKGFLRLVKNEGVRTYLETNGILADAIAELIDEIDVIAMDIKLPSSTGTASYWTEHEWFLKTALKKQVFIKLVVCSSTELKDIDRAIDLLIKLRAKNVPLVLQPNSFELSKELLAKVRRWEKHCARNVASVQVIPQLHKLTGVR